MTDRGKTTHMWRWGTPQDFLLAFIDELWKTWKIRILKKWKKIAGKIEKKKRKTIAHFTHVYQKLQSYEEQFLRYRVRQFFCHFGPYFALLPLKQPEKWKFHKNEKRTWRYCLLHKCTKNHDHMLCCSWDMACDTCNFYFSFWATFCPFMPPYQPKKSKLQKMKKTFWRYHHFTDVYQKLWFDNVWFLR